MFIILILFWIYYSKKIVLKIYNFVNKVEYFYNVARKSNRYYEINL